MPRSGVTGSSSSIMPSFLRNHQTDFQSGCTSLQSHQQWRSVPLSSHSRQHLLSHEFFILGILTGVRWNLRVVLICISLMTKEVEHFFRYFSGFAIPQVKILCLALYPIFKGDSWLSGVYLLEFFVYLGYKPSVGCSKDLFPVCWLLFCPFDNVLSLTKTL